MSEANSITLDRLKSALELKSNAKAKVSHWRARLEKGGRDAATASEKIEGLLKRHAAKAAEAYLSEKPAPEPTPNDRAKLRSYREIERAAKDARPLMLAELKGADGDFREASEALVPAFLDWKAGGLTADLQELRERLATLAAPMARLTAMDALQEAVIGKSFVVKDGTHAGLRSGGRVAADIRKSLSPFVKPEAFDEVPFETATAAELSIIQSIIGTN